MRNSRTIRVLFVGTLFVVTAIVIMLACWRLWPLVARSLARERKAPAHGGSSGFSSSSIGDDHAERQTSDAFPTEGRTISDEEKNKLHVEWGTPKIVDQYESRFLRVSGRLLIQDDSPKSIRSLDWFQPVRVVLASSCDSRPDWSIRHDMNDSTWQDCIVNWDSEKNSVTKSGDFEVRFPIYEIKRPVGTAQPFQIGLTMGERRGQSVEWNNRTPVLRQTIGTITIPGSPPISESLQLLCACPDPLGWDDYNPVTLIRAVNHLHSLGKDDAIAALRAFARLAPVEGSSVRHRKTPSIDTTDQQRLCLIIPMLFERIDPDTKYPTGEDSSRDVSDEWFDFRVSVEDDIPFHDTKFRFRTGPPDPPRRYLVEWAAKHGKLRDKPLRPADEPLGAADRLFAKLVAKQPDGNSTYLANLRTHIRHQAWRMVAPLIESERAKDWPGWLEDPEWQELKAKAERFNIRWSEERQEYVGDGMQSVSLRKMRRNRETDAKGPYRTHHAS